MQRSLAAATVYLSGMLCPSDSTQGGTVSLRLSPILGTMLLGLLSFGPAGIARSQVKFAPYQVPTNSPVAGRSRSISTGELPVQFAPYQLSAIIPSPVRTTLGDSLPWISFDLGGNPKTARPLTLWASYYNMRLSRQVKHGYALLDPAGQPLGPRLSHEDWCHAAMQGSVQVLENGKPQTYGYAGLGPGAQVNCAAFFPGLPPNILWGTNRVRFVPREGPYGYGSHPFQVVPYRTIAVDRQVIPIGSVVFIPAARGQAITLPSGYQAVHDGFFFAADTGGAVQGNHIDVFVGNAERNPFAFIKSTPSGTFRAYVIQDDRIAQTLDSLHRRPQAN